MYFIRQEMLFCLMFLYVDTRCAVARSFSFGQPTSGGASTCHPGAIQSAGLRHSNRSTPAGLSGRLGHPTLLALLLPDGFLPHRFHATGFGAPVSPLVEVRSGRPRFPTAFGSGTDRFRAQLDQPDTLFHQPTTSAFVLIAEEFAGGYNQHTFDSLVPLPIRVIPTRTLKGVPP